MNSVNKNRTKCFWARQDLYLVVLLGIMLLLPFAKAEIAVENESVQNFKMISTVEYEGKGQFRNHVEALFTAKRQLLPDDKVQYSLSTNDFDLIGGDLNAAQQTSSQELSFIVDRKNGYLSDVSEELTFFAEISNRCIESLDKTTKDNVGKTWKQSFVLPFFGGSLPDELKFTLTAISLESKVFDKMIAVRALSEPFIIKVPKEKGSLGDVKSSIGAVYLFDSEIENIHMSMSVFEATTRINGFKENLRHEVATYMTDSEGNSVDFSGLDKEFGKFVRKVGLTNKAVKVVKEVPLPRWAQSEGLSFAQIANICTATACEGAPNPVSMIYMPVSHTVAMQSAGKLAAISVAGTASGALAAGIPAVGAMKIAVAPAFMGVGLGTAGAIAGGTVGTVAIANDSSSSDRSPSN